MDGHPCFLDPVSPSDFLATPVTLQTSCSKRHRREQQSFRLHGHGDAGGGGGGDGGRNGGRDGERWNNKKELKKLETEALRESHRC